MVWKHEVRASGLYVKGLTKGFHGHGSTRYVPTGSHISPPGGKEDSLLLPSSMSRM
jgi:hypothetical protein